MICDPSPYTRMPAYPRYLQLDVFGAQVGGGNPLGVVVGADDWRDEDMQRFAAWTALVETTFVLPPTSPAASYRLRIFTPEREIAFAGHPTIGSAHVVLDSGFARLRDGGLVQQCGAGLLPIRVEGDGTQRQIFLLSPAARVLADEAAGAALLPAVLRDTALGALPPAFLEGGRRWWIAECASEAALRNWRPDHAAIVALARASDSLGLCAFARAFDTRTGAGYDLVVRAFPAGVGIVEDPASGAANGLIAAWIALREPGGPLAQGYRVSQGREIGRDAAIVVRIDEDGSIWVGGRTRTIISGFTHWRAT